MSNLNPLSGFDLVNKGITKNQATLPELGLKDVCSTGSWLEQKQIQAAIDARKHLISAVRIEKSSSLSHAEWRENLMLAEVTQKTGGHWQFMGHNVGKQLFLYPEEALFLMEINCLLLHYNDVKVSIQQAYSLLFRDNISLTQYMVYASLSRLGYKVLRHKGNNTKENSDDQRETSQEDTRKEDSVTDENKKSNKSEEDIPMQNADEMKRDNEIHQNKECNEAENRNNVTSKNSSDENDSAMEVCSTESDKADSEEECKLNVYRRQIQRIKNRTFRPSDGRILGRCFRSLQSVLNSRSVSIKVPEKKFVPENIEFNKAAYKLNLKALKSKRGRRASRSYSTSDDASGSHFPRARNVSEGGARAVPEGTAPSARPTPSDYIMARYPHLRPINFLRSQPMGFFHPNWFLPRNYPNLVTPRTHSVPRLESLYRPFYFETNPNRFMGYRKRTRVDTQSFNFESIKRLAARLKGLLSAGLPQTQSLEALNKLIDTYNNRYKTSVKLTADYEIVNAQAVETIDLEDDDAPKNKKPRLFDSYTQNLEDIKILATRLKELEFEGKTTARHRRAFSSLVRTFNKSYNAEICMNKDYAVMDKRHITLNSSSDSDCEVNDPGSSSGSSKKLRNPFNVLKRLSEKRTKKFPYSASTSVENTSTVDPSTKDPYMEKLMKAMGDNWLPGKDDFGRPDIPTSPASIYSDNSIYNYLKYHSSEVNNWAELKTAFLNSLEGNVKFVREGECHSIIKTEDCTDMASVMNKLSIIKRSKDSAGTRLRVVYDVYNRDVQNFRKTCPPTPHFRVLCFDQSSKLPTGKDIAGLYSKYNDGVLMVFAVVHEGSISYLQIKNVDLPLYLPNSNVS